MVAITKTALGGIAEYAIAPAVSVFDAPEQFDDAEATAFVLTFQTSHLALFRRGRLRAGETLVVHSAASGLGTAGIQLGKAAGARVIAVAGGPEKGALCASLGADLVVDHLTEDFVEAVLTATDDVGADVVYDLTGGDFAERSWRCTARGGRYLAVGFADDDEQRDDRPAAADGLHRQHRHRGRHGGLGGVGRPGHATVRLQPVRAGRGR